MVFLGVAIMTASGLASTGLFLASKAAKEWKYPWWSMMLACIFSMCLCLTAIALIRGTKLPPRREAQWILLRAFLSGSQFILSICAVQVGATAGDVAALMSINIVGAAVLGHFFLQERINCIQGGAAFLSCAGAVLVVQPPFLFGSGSSTSLLGCLLTVMAGFLRAGMYVSSRKCGQVSVVWPSLIVCIMCTPVFLVLSLLMDDAPVAVMVEKPLSILAFTVALLVVNVLGIVLGILGSIMCPAAVSAGVFTTSSMLSAYVAQSLLFNHAPSIPTIAGASAMLLAVFLLNFARVRTATPAIQRQSTFGPGMVPGEQAVPESVSDDSESLAVSDDNESLASFAAAEFAMVNPHMERVRLRKGGISEAKVVAETIGAFDLAI